jgi:hypothetical protein
MRRLLLLALVTALAAAACGSSSGSSRPGGGGGGGGGQVVINGAGRSVTLTDAVSCHNSAEYGMTVFAGSREAGDDQADGISLTIPTNSSLVATISGSLNGKAFALGPDARGAVSGNSGTWSGTDILGSDSLFSGSFVCA